MSLDPNKTYLVWNGAEFPNSTRATFKVPAGSSIDWGDGTVETFDTASTAVNTHTYTDGKTEHTIAISGLTSIDNEAFIGCSGLTRVTIPDSVTTIYNAAFGSCTSLTSVTFSENSQLKSISSNTFNSCISLKNIIIPDSITRIGNYAFWYCISLKNIIIPDSVKSINSNAFGSCGNLKQLILFPSSPPTLGSGAIPSNVQSIYVQQSSKAAYQAATNWTTFASKIVSDNLYLSFGRFNQKNKEYIDNGLNKKLTTPSNPTAESAVTMTADGTVGTKPLSEISGKVYQHRIVISKNEIVLTFNIYCSKNTKLTERELNDFQPSIASLSGESGFGAVTMDITYASEADIFNITISGVINNGGTATGYSNTLEKPTYTDNILQL